MCFAPDAFLAPHDYCAGVCAGTIMGAPVTGSANTWGSHAKNALERFEYTSPDLVSPGPRRPHHPLGSSDIIGFTADAPIGGLITDGIAM